MEVAFWLLFALYAITALAVGGRFHAARKHEADARYWRRSYEDLVKQTGRDLNDGLGRDPRSMKP